MGFARRGSNPLADIIFCLSSVVLGSKEVPEVPTVFWTAYSLHRRYLLDDMELI